MSEHYPGTANQELLIRGVLDRDPSAEEQFYTLVWSTINAHAHAWGVRADDLDDFSCEVVTKAFLHLHRFCPSRAKLTTWLFALGRNHAHNQRRDHKGDVLHGDWLELQSWMESGQSGCQEMLSEAAVYQPEIFDRLDHALGQLADEDRDLLNLILNGNQSAAEVAAALGMTAGQVRVRKLRLLQRLRDLLNP